MSTRIEVSSESGVVALAGPTAALPAGLDQTLLLRRLQPLARSAQIFFFLTDDPVRYRVDVIANEPLPVELDRKRRGEPGPPCPVPLRAPAVRFQTLF